MNADRDNSPIPDNAVEVITERYDSGAKQSATYLIDGKEIGFRWWEESGALGIEFGLKDGVKHGLYRAFDGEELLEDAVYVDGKEHGEHRQFHDGVCIATYTMEHGTGLDLWYNEPGVLAEEREYRDGARHGFERWWSHGNQTIRAENHFHNDIEHGIFRQWNWQGKLSRDCPRYYVNGQRVTKRQYQRACLTGPTLPRFDAGDNDPHRPLPQGVQSVPIHSGSIHPE
jgi:antitoxin component YwqK of YwqJK toxin-antitoxin module